VSLLRDFQLIWVQFDLALLLLLLLCLHNDELLLVGVDLEGRLGLAERLHCFPLEVMQFVLIGGVPSHAEGVGPLAQLHLGEELLLAP
jgi:hypothetical protein